MQPWVSEALARAAALGFLGGMPVDDQIDHALGFVSTFETENGKAPGSLIDLGSGGGVPGFVLLSCWPASRVVLIDSNERRTEFLQVESTARAATAEVEVIRGRAEEAAHAPELREQFDLVTSRSFGAPAVVAECGAPFLALGGAMIVSEPPGSSGEERWPVTALEALGLRPSTRTRFADSYGYQVLIKTAETPDRFPRRVGIPTKRPLF